MSIEKRVVKFYLDERVNSVDKERIYKFLSECQEVENKLIDYYWDNYNDVVAASNGKYFYNNRIAMPEPRLKFHHYMNLLFQVYELLKSIQSNIINNRMYFKIEDTEKQRVYNYCKNFCFDWDRLEKYIDKQLKKYKKKDENYYKFLLIAKSYLDNEDSFNNLKTDIENKFWEVKATINKPIKKEFQIRCSTFHTVKIDKTNDKRWIFTVDNNEVLSGTEKRAKFSTISIPVKVSQYHINTIGDSKLATTWNIKLNKYGKLEIIGVYEKEVIYPESPKVNNHVGIDIGLNNIIVTSDGEVIEQNPKIVKKLDKLVEKQANRQRLEEHLRKKYNNEEFKLGDKHYKKMENRLARFVTCDNRHKLKQLVESYEGTNTQIIMEDLDLHEAKTHHKKTNRMIKRLHIHRIKEDIMKYSKENGIKVGVVNPAYTSQTCSSCGHVSKENRKSQEAFKCVRCGHESNADINASINIKNRYFDDRISLNTPNWRIKEILES